MVFPLVAVAQLDKLHAKHVLPGFKDRSKEEKEIDLLATDITRVRRRRLRPDSR